MQIPSYKTYQTAEGNKCLYVVYHKSVIDASRGRDPKNKYYG